MGEYLRSSDYQDIDGIKEAIEKAVFNEAEAERTDFISFANEIVKGHEVADRPERAETLQVIIKKLVHYGESKRKKKIRFSDLTPSFIRGFERFLSEEYGNSPNTRAKNLKGLRAMIRVAIREGHMTQAEYPFFGYSHQRD